MLLEVDNLHLRVLHDRPARVDHDHPALHPMRLMHAHRRVEGHVSAAAAALRDGLRAGVSDEARATALESPAVKAGAHAIWKLPPRALWEDLAHRLRAVARVASEADDDVLAAATSLEGQLAHTYFMPFALVATSAVARIRAAMHQLMTDAVASYNVLAPLLNGGVLPPPGSDANGAYGTMPESLRCEWSPVRRGVATGAVRPAVHASDPAGPSTGTIDDDDWHWRLLGGSVGVKNARGGVKDTGTYRTDAGQAFGGEDLGAAVERTNVRGLSARVDRGEETKEESKEDEAVAPTYSTTGVGLGLGLDAGALTAAMRPPDLTATTDAKSGGKKRRKVSASGTAPAVPSESIAPKHDGDGQKKKKKKKKKGGAAPPGDDGAKPPMSAMDRAMAVLMGGK